MYTYSNNSCYLDCLITILQMHYFAPLLKKCKKRDEGLYALIEHDIAQHIACNNVTINPIREYLYKNYESLKEMKESGSDSESKEWELFDISTLFSVLCDIYIGQIKYKTKNAKNEIASWETNYFMFDDFTSSGGGEIITPVILWDKIRSPYLFFYNGNSLSTSYLNFSIDIINDKYTLVAAIFLHGVVKGKDDSGKHYNCIIKMNEKWIKYDDIEGMKHATETDISDIFTFKRGVMPSMYFYVRK